MVFGIVIASKLCIVLRKQLHTVVVNKDVGTASLHLVHRYRSLERFDRRHDDCAETLLVDRTLDSDMRKNLRSLFASHRWLARKVLRVALRLTDGSDELSDTSHDALEEEKTEPGL